MFDYYVFFYYLFSIVIMVLFFILIYTIFHVLCYTLMRFGGTFGFLEQKGQSKSLRQKFQTLFMESSFNLHIFSCRILMNEVSLLVK